MVWPYLSPPYGNVLLVDRDESTSVNSTTARKVTTNNHYVFPLYNYVFSISPNIPPTALAFIGLTELSADGPQGSLLGLLVAHSYANSSLLPSRETMLSELVARENYIRANGLDPYKLGHTLWASDTDPWDFQDNLARWLKDRGVPVRTEPGTGRYVETWRRQPLEELILIRFGWTRVQNLGQEAQWLAGLESEEEWGAMMRRLAKWEKSQEEKESSS